MNHDQERRARESSRASIPERSPAPGRESSSSQLRRPDHPIPSVLGQAQRKAPTATAQHELGALQMEATAPGTSYHAAPTMAQGTMLNAKGEAVGAPSAVVRPLVDDRMNVTIIASELAKLRMPAGEVPTSDQLYVCTPAGAPVVRTQGSLDRPNEVSTIVEDCLFIDGKPDAADIRQGDIFDCYFLTAVQAIVHQDPGTLISMMSSQDGQVSTLFHRREGGTFVPELITNKNTLLTNVNGKLQGASFRIASTPADVLWYAKLEDGVLQIIRENKYQCSMWAPLLEKNYADFAQRFGRYGEASLVGAGSGYQIIDRGASHHCYQLFYGDAAVIGATKVDFRPHSTDSILMQNEPALRQLVKLRESLRTPPSASKPLHFIQTRLSDLEAAKRCKALAELVIDRVDHELEPLGARALAEALRPLRAAVDKLIATEAIADSAAIANLARPIQQPGAHPLLWASSPEPLYLALRESLGGLVDIGGVRASGRRTITPGHAYNLRGVSFVALDGEALELTAESFQTMLPRIDAARSVITLENPVPGGEWDERGTGPADGVGDNHFELTLDQFLRNVDLLRWATITQQRAGGEMGCLP